MNPQIQSTAAIYAFNSLAVGPVLSDLSDEEAGRRCRQGEGSSISFLVGHLLSSRIGLLKRFGETTENPYAELFGGETSAQDPSRYPPIQDLAAAWSDVANRLAATLESLTAEQLSEPAEGFPIPDKTARGALAFISWHESYHVGQIGLLRTQMGKSPLKERLYEAVESAA